MPFVPAPNVAMVEMRAVRNLQKVENRITVDCFAEPSPTMLEDLAVACWNWWEGDYAPLLVSECILSEVVATSLHEENGPQFTYAPDTTTTGTLVAVPLPNEVSFCVSLRSGFRGRSARGRFFVLSLGDSQMQTTNTIKATAADDLTGAVQVLIGNIAALGFAMSVVSYRTNNAPRVGGPVYFPITSAIATDFGVDSMRSRKPGVGQ